VFVRPCVFAEVEGSLIHCASRADLISPQSKCSTNSVMIMQISGFYARIVAEGVLHAKDARNTTNLVLCNYQSCISGLQSTITCDRCTHLMMSPTESRYYGTKADFHFHTQTGTSPQSRKFSSNMRFCSKLYMTISITEARSISDLALGAFAHLVVDSAVYDTVDVSITGVIVNNRHQ